MTREEAIRIIKTVFKGENYRYNDSVTHMALDMAIESLSIPVMEYPQVDGITPHLIDSVFESAYKFTSAETYGKSANFADNSVTKSSNDAIKHKNDVIEHSATNKEKIADCDLISRAEVKRTIRDVWINKGHIPIEFDPFLAIAMDDINNIPSVSSERVGEWIVVSDGYGNGTAYICECSVCGDTVWVYKDNKRKWSYCPNCGAKMKGAE